MFPKIIIPAAGLGTRVNTPFDKSKEMNQVDGRPLIDFVFNNFPILAKHPIHIITRKEKTDLIDYCKDKANIQILDKPGKEWADTVLQSKQYWNDINFLFLPDTRFENPWVAADMLQSVQLGCNAAFGVFSVPNQKDWSTINNYTVTEKPNYIGPGTAWGVIAFRKEYGDKLFTALMEKDKPFQLEHVSFHTLEGFEDLTRKATIGI
jgi:dTDP-glucose pyrophosphorylase